MILLLLCLPTSFCSQATPAVNPSLPFSQKKSHVSSDRYIHDTRQSATLCHLQGVIFSWRSKTTYPTHSNNSGPLPRGTHRGDHHTISHPCVSRLKRPPFSYPSQLLMRIQWGVSGLVSVAN